MFKWLDRLFRDAEWRLSLFQIIFGKGGLVAMLGIAGGVTAWLTETLQTYAPFSYVAAGVLTALGGALVFWFFALARSRLQIIGLRDRISKISQHKSLGYRFPDLVPVVGGVISDKTFINCELVGPINAAFFQCHFKANSGEQVDAIYLNTKSPPKKWNSV